GGGGGAAGGGRLFKHWWGGEGGVRNEATLRPPTGQPPRGMTAAATQTARHYVKGREVPEPVLNRIEAGIRAFDPCLSCSTHAFGAMPLHLELVDSDGTVLDEVRR